MRTPSVSKFVRSKDDVENDYLVFGLPFMAAQARLGRARASRVRNLLRLGLKAPAGTFVASLFQPKQPRFLSDQPLHITHKQFAKENVEFFEACVAAGVEPTARQASKFRRGLGAAHAAMRKVA
jgi:hypothetical protein